MYFESWNTDIQTVLGLDSNYPGAVQSKDRLEKIVKEKQEKLKDEMLGKLKDLGSAHVYITTLH